MPEVVYRSEVRIERVNGPLRRAYLPAETTPVIFGVHGAVAEHYKVPPALLEPHATTLDTLLPRLPVDLPEPLEARWRRVKSTHRTHALSRKQWVRSSWRIMSSSSAEFMCGCNCAHRRNIGKLPTVCMDFSLINARCSEV